MRWLRKLLQPWMLAILCGSGVAFVLWFFLVSRPERIVELPPTLDDETYSLELDRYQFSSAAQTSEPCLDWVPVLPSASWIGGDSPLVFVKPDTGQLVTWKMPLPSGALRTTYQFDTNGRFLVLHWLPTIDDPKVSSPAEVVWFNPDTGESGLTKIPESCRDNYGIANDGTAWVSCKVISAKECEFRVFDLRTESIRSVCRIRTSDPLPIIEGGVMYHVSKDGNRIAIPVAKPDGYCDPIDAAFAIEWNRPLWTAVETYDCRTGMHIETRWGGTDAFAITEAGFDNVGKRPPKPFEFKSLHYAAKADPHLWFDFRQDRLQAIARNGEVLAMCPTDYPGDYYDRSGYMLVPKTTGVVVVLETEHNPTWFEEFIKPVASKVKLDLGIEDNGGKSVVWWDWKTGEVNKFLSATDKDELPWNAVVLPRRVVVLVNREGPIPRLEFWQAPPTRLPVLTILFVSLFVSLAIWIHLRGRHVGID